MKKNDFRLFYGEPGFFVFLYPAFMLASEMMGCFTLSISRQTGQGPESVPNPFPAPSFPENRYGTESTAR